MPSENGGHEPFALKGALLPIQPLAEHHTLALQYHPGNRLRSLKLRHHTVMLHVRSGHFIHKHILRVVCVPSPEVS